MTGKIFVYAFILAVVYFFFLSPTKGLPHDLDLQLRESEHRLQESKSRLQKSLLRLRKLLLRRK